jgi:hypothetical protein
MIISNDMFVFSWAIVISPKETFLIHRPGTGKTQRQSMLSTIMFRNSLLTGRFEACGIICQIPRTCISKNRRINWQGNRETERHYENRDFLQCAVTNEVKMRVLLDSSFQKL